MTFFMANCPCCRKKEALNMFVFDMRRIEPPVDDILYLSPDKTKNKKSKRKTNFKPERPDKLALLRRFGV